MKDNIIDDRIKGLTAELAALESEHNAMVQQHQAITQAFQQKVSTNQVRYAQLQGAITELTKLKQPKGKNNEPSIDEFLGGNAKPGSTPDQLPNPDHRARHHRRTPVGD